MPAGPGEQDPGDGQVDREWEGDGAITRKTEQEKGQRTGKPIDRLADIRGYDGNGRRSKAQRRRHNKRMIVLAACWELSKTRERWSAQDVEALQYDVKFRKRFARHLGPGHVALTFRQVYQVMAGAPYLVEDGRWERSTYYRIDPEQADSVREAAEAFERGH